MFRPFSGALALAATAAFSTAVVAQEPARQILKDVWAATNQQLLEVDLDTNSLEEKSSGGSAFKAIAFEPPVLGGTGAAERGLLAVDGTAIKRFENTTEAVELMWSFPAGTELSVVTGVAATDEGTVLVSGYSRRKRTYELWEYFPASGQFQARASGTPQLVDIVFVPSEDVADDERLAGGGLLATAGKQVLFFPKVDNYMAVDVLADAKSLALKGATDLTSADFIRETSTLLVATTERKLIKAAAFGGVPTPFANVPSIPSRNCVTLKPQRLIVRNVEPGNEGASAVSDACGQVVLYDYGSATVTPMAATSTLIHSSGLVALAVAEGNEVTCPAGVACTLISRTDPEADYPALSATIDSDDESQLIVLQFPELCDSRIATAPCFDPAQGGTLHLKPLLPQALQDALGAADITIPPYMLSASYDGRFGVVFVQADENAFDAPATVELEISQLIGRQMGVALGLPRLPASSEADPERLLNQDIAAYAPDNSSLPTVDGFEATPITTGWHNPMMGGLRGFSAITYGWQHDVFPASDRNVPVPAPVPGEPPIPGVGIPTGGVNGTGALPSCRLQLGSLVYEPSTDPRRYFLNLIACLFQDEERMLTEVIPFTPQEDVFEVADLAALQTALDQVKDKLLKALSGAGPNTGSETFGAVQSQLSNFDALVAATDVRPAAVALGYAVYKNELLVRSRVLRFNIVERAVPSIPIGGFPTGL